MNLKSLEILLAIDRSGSFAEAGRQVGLSQPAISMQIKGLEGELGVELFDRSVRPVALTDAARAMLEPVRAIVGLVELLHGLASGPPPGAGNLRLGAVPTAAAGWLPGAVTALGARRPGTRVEVVEDDCAGLLRSVSSGDLDAAVVPGPVAPGTEVTRVPLLTERVVLLTATTGATGGAGLPVLCSKGERALGAAARHLGGARRPVVHLDSIEVVLGLVARGMGVALLPEGALPVPLPVEVAVRPLPDPRATRTLWLVHRVDGLAPDLARELVAALRDTAANRAARIEGTRRGADVPAARPVHATAG
ncbi:LysR family transcriptional regulator [Actinokineospora sp. PR83]|uniref:LysR family transcriptional regulator n=1 Tax=Actinokineospora sp. PR83 TaxID=2884908 RepID=UPI0027DEB0FA|nr:LysR family transcriptional regulator [Actinokineospora sp. PR83]MCG8917157.1 LysR family transcriptional regulator [Actinokineospora sp. PR83]